MLAKTKLNTIEVLISKSLIYSNISHAKFVLVNNVIKEYDDKKEEIKNSNNKYVRYNKKNTISFISAQQSH